MNARITPRRLFAGSIAAALLLCAGAVWPALRAQPAGEPGSAIPDFSSNKMTWVLMNGTAYFRVPGDTGPGPIVDMPGHEYIADYNTRVADTSNPILKPWAKKLMDINNERVLAGGIPFYPTSRCWPGGVPGLLLLPRRARIFRPDPERGLDPLSARRAGAADLHERAAQQEVRVIRYMANLSAITRMATRWSSIRSDWTTAARSTGSARRIRSNCMSWSATG